LKTQHSGHDTLNTEKAS